MKTGQSGNKLIERFRVYSSRGGELSIGLAAKYLSDRAFDYLLYPLVIFKLGILKGGIVMTFLAFILNIMTMTFYDWSKRDWIGIEAIKDLKTYSGKKMIGRFTSWILQRSDSVIFLFLSLRYDAFTTTAYLRRGKFNGMSRRDWMIFMGSLLISNAYWTLACYMGITLFEWGWKAIAG
ncbi:MAG: hypothetical protein AABY42_06385 [Nitrospirota bacterium]